MLSLATATALSAANVTTATVAAVTPLTATLAATILATSSSGSCNSRKVVVAATLSSLSLSLSSGGVVIVPNC
ncbi:hypothetical protein DEO72_LG7g651 [Vigna unguiculata]|uniref:Secreted protein n=1 Tax=Vigna unguiculata TaxID=3917 RepID=A0A4D6MF49_VIGUN|nr:hypothetical protein DEO72_LG7g651 [Vigna unguiculata]